jgi:apolipoprotein N-acyltransferase
MLPPNPPNAPARDPYDVPPSFMERHREAVGAAVVFVLTAGLAVFAFPPFKAPEFAYAMLVPGIYWAYTRPRLKVFAWTICAAQAVAWTIILGWLHHVTWVGLILLGPFVGAWIGSWYLAAWWTMPRIVGQPTIVRLLALLALAAMWVLIEWTRTWLLGGFPWLPLAASQWERVSVLQIAAYTGSYGVSFVLVAVNVGFAAYAHRLFREGAKGLNKRSQEFFLALFLLIVCLTIHVQDTFNRGRFLVPFARVAIVQPDIPQEIKWDPAKAPGIFDALEKTTLAAALTKPDLLLWPEAVTPFAINSDISAKAWIESLVQRTKSPLLLGSLGFEHAGQPDERWFNGAFLVTPAGGLQADHYLKRTLVPFGEYVPLRPLLGWIKKFAPIGDDDPLRGVDSSPLVVPLRDKSAVFGPLICYEDTFPELARRSAVAGSDVLVVLTNNAWFGEGGAAVQHAAHSVLRAVETRRPVLRCGNAGWSGWIDEFGNVRSVLTNDEGSIYYRGSRVLSVTRDSRLIGKNSFYVEHGDWFVAVCALVVLLGAGILKNAPASAPEKSAA